MSTNENTTNTKNNKGLLIGLGVLLLASIAFNIIQFINCKAEAEQAKQEYTKLSNDHEQVNQLLEDSKELTKKLEGDVAEKDEEIQSSLAQIERIKAENDSLIKSGMDKEELNRRLKANLALVRKLNKQLESKVDELLMENKKLESKNNELTENLDSLNSVASVLSKKVAIASALQVPEPSINTYKKRNSSSNPWKKTSLARRTNKIEVEFTVMENEIAEPGEKEVLLKIISPEGKTVGSLNQKGGDYDVQANGATTYAAHKTFTYSGQAQKVVLEYVKAESNLPEGTYHTEIIIDGESVNKSSFELK